LGKLFLQSRKKLLRITRHNQAGAVGVEGVRGELLDISGFDRFDIAANLLISSKLRPSTLPAP